MADYERTTTTTVDPDTAFAYLADPLHLADAVPMVTHIESVVVDGDPAVAAEAGGEVEAASEARFLADPETRTIEWGFPGTGYEGVIQVSEGLLASMSKVAIRLHVGDDADPNAVQALLEAATRNVRQALARR